MFMARATTGSADFGIDLETAVVMHEDMRTNTRCRLVFDERVRCLSGRLR